MKIVKALHVVASLSLEWGGPTKVVVELTEALARKGLDISIFSPVREGEEAKVIYPQGVRVRLFKQGGLSALWTSYSRELAKAAREEVPNVDLVHIHEPWHHPHFAAYRAAKRARKPYIITPHGAFDPWCLNFKPLKKRIYSALIQKRTLREAGALHAITKEEIHQIRAFGANGYIAMIPNGINSSDYRELPPREQFENSYPELVDKRVVLFLSRIHPKKGLDLLATTFGQIAEERNDALFVIVGPDDGGYQAQVEQMLKANGVRDKTIFTGMLTGQEKLAALSRADIFVLPSYSEGFSMAILEAMICGLPVVITHQCHFPEVDGAKAGIVIDPDSNQLAEALAKLLDDPKLREEMGANGRRLILEKYTWDKIADQMIQLYEQVLRSRK